MLKNILLSAFALSLVTLAAGRALVVADAHAIDLKKTLKKAVEKNGGKKERKPASAEAAKVGDTPAPAGGCWRIDYKAKRDGACVSTADAKACRLNPKFASRGPCEQCLSKFSRPLEQHRMGAMQGMRSLKTCKNDWMVLEKAAACSEKLQKEGRAPASEISGTKKYVEEFGHVERLRKESRASGIAGCELN